MRVRWIRPGDVSDFRSTGARGVSGKVGSEQVLIGNRRLLEEAGVIGLDALGATLGDLEARGRTAVIVAADVRLVRGELTGVVEAMRLSKATFRKIVENLIWASGYNVATIPIAAMGLLHPMIGVIAMTASSLSVIGNSILLKRAKIAA